MAPLPVPRDAKANCRLGHLTLSKGGCLNASTKCSTGVSQVPMCLASTSEHVSVTIDRLGHWPDCDWLVKLYAADWLPRRFVNEHNPIFVDVGANLGACTLELATRLPFVRVLAFEPGPANLYHLTSTLHMNAMFDQTLLHRVAVLPFALGSQREKAGLVQNGGMSFISARGNANGTAALEVAKEPKTTVKVHTLDKVLLPEAPVRLIKVDVQGFECGVFQGAARTLQGVASLAVEASGWVTSPMADVLHFMPCCPAALLLWLIRSGHRIETHLDRSTRKHSSKTRVAMLGVESCASWRQLAAYHWPMRSGRCPRSPSSPIVAAHRDAPRPARDVPSPTISLNLAPS